MAGADGQSRFTSLRANLVDCSNRGRLAFLDAEDGMLRINNISHIIYDKVRGPRNIADNARGTRDRRIVLTNRN